MFYQLRIMEMRIQSCIDQSRGWSFFFQLPCEITDISIQDFQNVLQEHDMENTEKFF